MPVTCIVIGCGSRSNRDIVGFYSVPAVTNYRFVTKKNELSEKRRALWLAAIRRSDLTASKLKYQKVCSKHFISGKPAALEDENNPDWVPSQNMGYVSPKEPTNDQFILLLDCMMKSEPSDCMVKSEPSDCMVKSEPSDCMVKSEPSECMVKSEPSDCMVKSAPSVCMVKSEPLDCIVKSEPLDCIVKYEPLDCIVKSELSD